MGYKKSRKFRKMTHAERQRLRRKLEYLRGYLEALSWVQMDNPCDEQLEAKIDALSGVFEDLKKILQL